MAGGRFDKRTGKTRPGTYINFESSVTELIQSSDRGVVVLPLIGHDYGPEGEFITIDNGSPDEHYNKLGYSVYDAGNQFMLMIREALKLAKSVIVYMPKTGTKATGTGGGLTGTAKYGGTRGNQFSFSVASNAASGWDVNVYIAGTVVEEFVGITNAAQLTSEYIDFVASSDIEAVAGVALEDATATEASNSDITAFLDKLESITFNTLAFPSTEQSLQTACKSKIAYMRENMGRCVNAVLPNFAGNYEGIINVTNSVILSDATLTVPQVTAWVAAAYASATETQSNTYLKYEGAVAVNGLKTHEESITAINSGEFFFTNLEDGSVAVEYDINSLISFGDGKDSSYRKNRVIRVLDAIAKSIQDNFPPNKFDNDEDGWNIMEGIGVSLLKEYEEEGAIKNVDTEADFLVDKVRSSGDSTYFDVAITPVDSAEKLYFSVTTR